MRYSLHNHIDSIWAVWASHSQPRIGRIARYCRYYTRYYIGSLSRLGKIIEPAAPKRSLEIVRNCV